jgi:hypothetical protein
MRVQQLLKSGEFIKEFSSETEAALELGLTSTLIKWVCEGKRSSHGGFGWRYVEGGSEVVSVVPEAGSGVGNPISRFIYIIFYHAGFSSKPLDKYYFSLDNAINHVRTLLDDSELKDNDSLERNHINKYRYYLRNSNYYEIVCLVEGD